jgi:hypothetical protein
LLQREDATEALFSAADANRIARCVWGCEDRRKAPVRWVGRDLAYCEFAARLVRHWWGRMALSWDMVDAWERERGSLFDAVLFSRPDLAHAAPLAEPCGLDTERFWYSTITPPDGLWLFKRSVARDVLQTARLIVGSNASECGGRPAPCCRAGRPTSYWFSYAALCRWARVLWPSGMRVRVFDGVRASTALRQGALAVADVNAGRDGRPKPRGFALRARPAPTGGVHCGWA